MYEISMTLKNRDVNRYRKLRTSRFMEIIQECSIAHTTELGYGRERTLDKGLLWVIMQQHFDFFRIPEYDEQIRMSTWPGEMSHVLFPRFYRMTSETGETLAEGSMYWLLINARTRNAIFPEEYGIHIGAEEVEKSPALPKVMKKWEPDAEETFTVPFSWCDLNGHMNNTKYFDLLENIYPPAPDWEMRTADAEYRSEAEFGGTYRLEKQYRKDEGQKTDSRRIELLDNGDRAKCRILVTGETVV